MTRNQNFVMQLTPSIIDTEYTHCNFSQQQPVDVGGGVYEGVRIFPGDDTPRTFIECNLGNCEVPPGSTVTRCNTWMRQTNLVTSTETITIDGEGSDIDHHIHRVHGKWTPSGYEYLLPPRDLEVD